MTYRDPNVVYSPLVLDPDEVAPQGWNYIRPQPQQQPFRPFGGQQPAQLPVPRPPQLQPPNSNGMMQPNFRPRQQPQQPLQPQPGFRPGPFSLGEAQNSYFKHRLNPNTPSYATPEAPDVGSADPTGMMGMPPRGFQAPQQRSRHPGYQFDDNIEAAIAQAAQEYNIPLPMMRAMARIESGGNPAAVTGSYRGLYQLSRTEGRGDLMDPVNNARYAAQNFRAQIDAFKAKYGREPTAAEIYLQHQQGVGGAAAHMANPDELAWKNMHSTGEGRQKGENWAKRAIWGNVPTDVRDRYPGGVESLTSRDFMQIWEDKMRRFGGYGDEGPPQASSVRGGMAQQPPKGQFAVPTEEDLSYLEQNPDAMDKFEKRFGPVDKYFDVEEAADTSEYQPNEYDAAILASGLDGAMLGGGDEVVPWIMSQIPGRGSYEDERALYQRLTGKLAARNPGIDTGVRLGAGILAPLGVAGKTAKYLFGNPLTKPGTLKTLAGLMGSGAAVGGVAGYNEGEGGPLDESRFAGAAQGAGTGAVIGPLIGGAARGARGVYRAFRPAAVSDKVAARLADPVLKDLKRIGGPAGLDTEEALINQTGKATAKIADEVAGGNTTVAKKLAQAMIATGFRPTGSNLLRWAHSWFKANRDKLNPKEQKDMANLLMNPKSVEEAMQRIMAHRTDEMGRLGREFRTDATIGGLMSGTSVEKESDRRRIKRGRPAT